MKRWWDNSSFDGQSYATRWFTNFFFQSFQFFSFSLLYCSSPLNINQSEILFHSPSSVVSQGNPPILPLGWQFSVQYVLLHHSSDDLCPFCLSSWNRIFSFYCRLRQGYSLMSILLLCTEIMKTISRLPWPRTEGCFWINNNFRWYSLDLSWDSIHVPCWCNLPSAIEQTLGKIRWEGSIIVKLLRDIPLLDKVSRISQRYRS